MKLKQIVSLLLAVGLTLTASLGMAEVPSATYVSQYNSMAEVLSAGEALNLQIASEGMVLLKNEEAALPLAADALGVTVLGTAAKNLQTGGAGSGRQLRPGGERSKYASEAPVTLFEAFEAAGIQVNPDVRARYETVASLEIPETGGSDGLLKREGGHYMNPVDAGAEVTFAGQGYQQAADGSLVGCEGSYAGYGTAVVVISRSGSEGSDSLSHGVAGHADENEHYLQLDDAEREMLAYAKLNFKKVIVLINSPAVMELGDIQDDEGIQAVLWIGLPGWNGVMAVGDILTGKVNPSGRTVDLYMRDFRTDPTWYNFGDYAAANYAVNGEYAALETMGTDPNGEGLTDTAHVVDYAEGLYVGYRYYETVAADLGDAGEEWYAKNVVYPFGYGLSYTTFAQKIEAVEGDLSNPDGEILVKVKVENTGNMAGKEVAQLYATAPYEEGGIDKVSAYLVGFAKTGLLAPGESETVEIRFAVKDLASFDYDDANWNEFYGYELEEGTYTLSLRANSHTVIDTTELEAESALTWEEDDDPETPNNIYSQDMDSPWGSSNTLAWNWTVDGESHYLTRDQLTEDGEVADLTEQLAWLLDEEQNVFADEAFFVMNHQSTNDVSKDLDNWLTSDEEDDYENLWYIAEVPENWTQGAGVIGEDGLYGTILYDMAGVALDDPRWDDFLNQLTWQEMIKLSSNGSFRTDACSTIGKDVYSDNDGPGQLDYRGWAYCCEVLIASTWNVDLAYEQGVVVGNESMWMDDGTRGYRNVKGVRNGWYGPAMNLHRSPLGGRVFENYAQDGLLSGKIGAAVIRGATDMGVHVYVKHTILNDQETYRGGIATFATEQAIREIYAKPFELAVKEGHANGMMAALNRLGVESSASYTTNVQLLSNEWGYEGLTVTDWWSGSVWSGYRMIRGLMIPLGDNTKGNDAIAGEWDASLRGGLGALTVNGEECPTQWYWTRETVKRLLYVSVNSNGSENGYNQIYLNKRTEKLTVGQPCDILIFGEYDGAVRKAFGEIGFHLEVTGLPDGVTYDAERAALVGTPTAAGSAKVSVRLSGNGGLGFITDSAKITLEIAEAN